MDARALSVYDNPRAVGLSIFFACLFAYHLNGKPQFEVDCVTPPYTAWSLARHATLNLHYYTELKKYVGTEIVQREDGSWIAYRPPGTALAMLPFVAPLALCRENPPAFMAMMHLGKLAAAAYSAASVVVFYVLMRRLVPSKVIPATILFALGTSVWSIGSQASWAHGPAVCCISLALTLQLPPMGQRLRLHSAVLAGLALGLAVLARPTTMVFYLASCLALLFGHGWRQALALAASGALPLAALFAFQVAYFGDPISGGYGSNSWNDRAPLWMSLSGLLISPSGLFVFTPALLLAGPGLLIAWRTLAEHRAMIACWTGAFCATALCFARWPCSWAGCSYGPRFFCETMPLVCLLAAIGLTACQASWQSRLAWSLIGVSILVHSVGVFGHSALCPWYERHMNSRYGRDMFALRDNLIEASGRHVFEEMKGHFCAAATP